MPTLPELLETLADDGEVAGFDAVFARAVAALGDEPHAVAMSTRRRHRRRIGWMAATAIVVAAAIAVPLIVVANRGDHTKPSHPARITVTTAPPRVTAVEPNVPSATSAQLATWKWSTSGPPFRVIGAQFVAALWDGREVLMIGDRNVLGYEPSTGTWEHLPTPRLPAPIGVAVWTGREVLAWSVDPIKGFGPGAAFNPATRQWRALAAPYRLCPTLSGSALRPAPVWTGTRALLFGHRRQRPCRDIANREVFIVQGYDPSSDRWRDSNAAIAAQPDQKVDAIDAVYAGGRVVARVDWISLEGNGVTLSKRSTTWRPGDYAWTTLPPSISNASPVALDKGVAIPPGSACMPYERCAFGGASDGWWYPSDGTRGRAIPVPDGARYVGVTASAGGALVATIPFLGGCPVPGCAPRISAWDPTTNHWSAIPQQPRLRAPGIDGLIWTGHALVAVSSYFPSIAPTAVVQIAVLKPAR